MRRLLVICAVAIVAASIAVPAFAGKRPGGGGGSTGSGLTLVVLQGTTPTPSFGNTVTFAFQSSAAKPWVNVRCSKLGVLVYNATVGYFAGYEFTPNFVLGPTGLWTGGAASCVADLVSYGSNGRKTIEASTSFNVLA